ncbi:hypothetical protein ACFFKU_06870 [Kineococcus gynurae]|uniref:DUF3168 domain-containing protein n=1 Tax=Kineococcus gynurae TaxID=452979 RepID=A0ABV5LWZ9_9ACTN
MRPQSGTRLITAYTAVLDLLTAQLVTVGFEVIDGPRAAQNLPNDVLLLATGGDIGMTMTQARAGLGARRDESFTLRAVLSTWSGDTDLGVRRERIEAALNVLDQLTTDRTLFTGVLDDLRLGEDFGMEQQQTTDGAVIEVVLTLVGRILR